MIKQKRALFIGIGIISLFIASYTIYTQVNAQQKHFIGEPIDSLNHVVVYYNGSVNNVEGRNTTSDGYNIGQKYQCVEFVKRYYYEYLNHKMPDSYGHAKDFFNPKIKDGKLNPARNLIQYSNPSEEKPTISDLIVFNKTRYNSHGHVAIVSDVTENDIEVIQQNPGPKGKSRVRYHINFIDGKWRIDNDRILGWLRKK